MNVKHGMRNSPEYQVWRAIKKRCHDPRASGYDRYGARGIQVCQRWRDSFEAFYADMGPRPAGTTIDRKNNAGHYEPGNCRWATAREQCENKTNNVQLTITGVTRFVREWSEISGIPIATIRNRMHLKWPEERLLEQPRSRSPNGVNLKRGKHRCPHCQTALTIYNLRRHVERAHQS